MDKIYCVYQVSYRGNLLPKFYIGSTSINKVESGKYYGSIKSKKWSEIFKNELKNNRHLFSIEILSKYDNRTDALIGELDLQIKNDVVKSDLYMNESLACINGMFGRDVRGKNNPMFGRKRMDVSLRMMGNNNISKLDDVREKLKIAKIGYKPISHVVSEESRKNMSKIALNRSKEVLENIQEKKRLTYKINTDKKYNEFIMLVIIELKNRDGIIETSELRKIFNDNPVNFITNSLVVMKKRGLIHSIFKGNKSLCILN